MTKGEMLDHLLKESDSLHNQMNQIFIKQGLRTTDLSLLTTADKESWLALYEESKKVTDRICKLINENKINEYEI